MTYCPVKSSNAADLSTHYGCNTPKIVLREFAVILCDLMVILQHQSSNRFIVWILFSKKVAKLMVNGTRQLHFISRIFFSKIRINTNHSNNILLLIMLFERIKLYKAVFFCSPSTSQNIWINGKTLGCLFITAQHTKTK